MEWTGARYADTPTVQVEVTIDAPPERVWQLVSDPLVMPELSDELQSVHWEDGSTGGLGARFVGANAHPAAGVWTTVSTVVEHEPPRRFAWAVTDPDEPSGVWRFTLEPEGGGTRLTQEFQLGPGRSGLSPAIEARPEAEQKIVFVRMREHEVHMQQTLTALKQRLEP